MVLTKGNPYAHMVLRGGSNGANFGGAAVADANERLTRSGLAPSILVDCSHGNSDKDYTRQSVAFWDIVQQRLDGNGNLQGCMLESHLSPGNQKLTDDPSQLRYGVSITDACIGWDETEQLLSEAYEVLAGSANSVG